MKKNLLLLLVLMAMVTLFASCSKDDEKKAETSLSENEKMLLGPWENDDTKGTLDFDFNADRTYNCWIGKYEEGKPTSKGTWRLSDGLMLILTEDGTAETYQINELNEEYMYITVNSVKRKLVHCL